MAVPRERSLSWSLVISRWVPHSTKREEGDVGGGGDPGRAGLEVLDLHRPGDGGLREDADDLAAVEELLRDGQGPLAVGAVDLDVAAGLHDRPGHRWSNSSRFAMNRGRRPILSMGIPA